MKENEIPPVSVETVKENGTNTTQANISELERLIKIGTVELVEEVCGIPMKMHSLKESEKILALGLIKVTEGTAITNVELSKIALLSYSITLMGSQEFISQEQKLELFKKLHLECQASVIDMLYDKYNDLVIKQFEIIDSFKKK